MSLFTSIYQISNKIGEIDYTNSEILELNKNQPAVHFLHQINHCQHEKDEQKYFQCLTPYICPSEITNFSKCHKENIHILLCTPYVLKIEDCIKNNYNNILSSLEKVKNY